MVANDKTDNETGGANDTAAFFRDLARSGASTSAPANFESGNSGQQVPLFATGGVTFEMSDTAPTSSVPKPGVSVKTWLKQTPPSRSLPTQNKRLVTPTSSADNTDALTIKTDKQLVLLNQLLHLGGYKGKVTSWENFSALTQHPNFSLYGADGALEILRRGFTKLKADTTFTNDDLLREQALHTAFQAEFHQDAGSKPEALGLESHIEARVLFEMNRLILGKPVDTVPDFLTEQGIKLFSHVEKPEEPAELLLEETIENYPPLKGAVEAPVLKQDVEPITASDKKPNLALRIFDRVLDWMIGPNDPSPQPYTTTKLPDPDNAAEDANVISDESQPSMATTEPSQSKIRELSSSMLTLAGAIGQKIRSKTPSPEVDEDYTGLAAEYSTKGGFFSHWIGNTLDVTESREGLRLIGKTYITPDFLIALPGAIKDTYVHRDPVSSLASTIRSDHNDGMYGKMTWGKAKREARKDLARDPNYVPQPSLLTNMGSFAMSIVVPAITTTMMLANLGTHSHDNDKFQGPIALGSAFSSAGADIDTSGAKIDAALDAALASPITPPKGFDAAEIVDHPEITSPSTLSIPATVDVIPHGYSDNRIATLNANPFETPKYEAPSRLEHVMFKGQTDRLNPNNFIDILPDGRFESSQANKKLTMSDHYIIDPDTGHFRHMDDGRFIYEAYDENGIRPKAGITLTAEVKAFFTAHGTKLPANIRPEAPSPAPSPALAEKEPAAAPQNYAIATVSLPIAQPASFKLTETKFAEVAAVLPLTIAPRPVAKPTNLNFNQIDTPLPKARPTVRPAPAGDLFVAATQIPVAKDLPANGNQLSVEGNALKIEGLNFKL